MPIAIPKIWTQISPSPPEGEEGSVTLTVTPHLGQRALDDDVGGRLSRGRVRHDGPEVGVGAGRAGGHGLREHDGPQRELEGEEGEQRPDRAAH